MQALSELYVHVVWSTWDRQPLLGADVRPPLYACITAQAERVGARVLAIGGVEDHVHVLATYPARMSVSELVRNLKGASAAYARSPLRIGGDRAGFRWQGGYGAFSVSRRGIPAVETYIANQHRHHRANTLIAVLERTSAPRQPA